MIKNILTIGLILCNLGFNLHNFFYISSTESLYKKILVSKEFSIEQYGCLMTFSTKEEALKLQEDLIEILNIDSPSTKVDKNKDNFYTEFSKGNSNGIIKIFKEDGENLNAVSISLRYDYSDLNYKKDCMKILKKYSEDKISVYLYAKGKYKGNDINMANKILLQELKNLKIKDIDTVNIQNGYSSVAKSTWLNGGRLNFATCNYNSGNYVILGTPEITTSY